MRLANTNETTVLLDGQGADELLAGYQYYFPSYQLDLLDRRQLVKLARDTHAFRRRLRAAAELYPDTTRRFNPDVALGWRDLAAALKSRSAVYHNAYDVGVPPPVPGMRLRRILAEALQYNSLPQLLRYADRNAMAFSRETRFPFLDYELVDWLIALPDAAYVDRGWQKSILRSATGDLLPSKIRWRADKVGYAAPLDLWLRDALKEWARERLFEGRVREISGYDEAAITGLWRDHQSGVNNSWALWRWISLSEWLDLHASGAWEQGLSPVAELAASRRGSAA